MCEKYKIISSVKNGELSVCKGCKNYNLIFNNIFFQFNNEQLNMFTEYISKLDTDYWLEHGANNTQKRKIPVTTFHQNLILVFNNQEIEELKILLDINKGKTNRIIAITDIDYSLILN